MHFLNLQTPLGFRQEKHILPFSGFSHLSSGLKSKKSIHLLTLCLCPVMGQGNFSSAGGFQGLEFTSNVACTVVSDSLPNPSSSGRCTLKDDLTGFLAEVACTSLELGLDQEHSFVFL